MSKFEELGEAMEEYDKKYNNYKFECANFTDLIRNKFVEYLECPNDNINFAIVKQRPFEDTTLKKAMSFESDSFFHIGLSVVIYKKPRHYPRTKMWFKLLVKKIKDDYLVGLGGDVTFTIPNNNFEKLDEFFDFFYEEIKSSFEGFEEFIEKGQLSEKMEDSIKNENKENNYKMKAPLLIDHQTSIEE